MRVQGVRFRRCTAYAVSPGMVGDAEAGADITQDAFFAAYRALASFKGGSFRAWLYRIVSNGCFDHFRTQARRPTTSLEAALGDERDGESPGMGSGSRLPSALVDASWGPAGVALRAEQIEQIEAALQKLAPEQRLALILSDIQGLSYEEIARVTNASLGTVKSRIARARGHMRGILARRGELFR